MNSHSKKMIEFIKKSRAVTSSDVAKFLKVSWNTADRYLTELLIEKKVDRIKKEGVTIWLIKE